MIKIEKYTGTKTYMFPNGTLATPEAVNAENTAWQQFTHIVETDEVGEVMFALQNLAAIRSQMGIDPALNEAEAIQAIQDLRNAPQPEPQPSPEERMAAAMEFQNLMMV